MFLYLTFGSTHGALRAEALLRSSAVDCRIVPKPRAIRGSCGLALRVSLAEAEHALAVLEADGHPPRQQAHLA